MSRGCFNKKMSKNIRYMDVPTAKDIGITKLLDKVTNSVDLLCGLDRSG